TIEYSDIIAFTQISIYFSSSRYPFTYHRLNYIFCVFLQKFQSFWEQIFSYIFIFKILGKLNEKQLDDVLELLMDGLGDNYKDIHIKCAKLLAKWNCLNERQLNNAFDDGKNQICDKCIHTLAMLSLQLGGKQLDNIFQYLINRFMYIYEHLPHLLETIAMKLSEQTSRCYLQVYLTIKLNKGHLSDSFQHLINVLKDKSRSCVKVLGHISVKLNERQLEETFNAFIKFLNTIN
ncbi:hypothetical protein RFI_38879, partial [Reticulomyxa filosa]